MVIMSKSGLVFKTYNKFLRVNNNLRPSAFISGSQLFSETLKDILSQTAVQQDWKEGRPVNQIEIVSKLQ